MTRCSRCRESGLSVLECAATVALTGLVLATTAGASRASASLLKRTRALADTVDVARNLLEHELGSPCAPAWPCPAGYRCSVTRTPVTAAADRVTATVEREDGEAVEELRSLAPAPGCGG